VEFFVAQVTETFKVMSHKHANKEKTRLPAMCRSLLSSSVNNCCVENSDLTQTHGFSTTAVYMLPQENSGGVIVPPQYPEKI